jgi:hypothetical protein
MPISRAAKTMDNGSDAPKEFTAPQPGLFANIVKGILGGKLQWALILVGVMIAIALELCGVAALPVAVGMYLSLGSTIPIFVGGMMRLIAERLRGKPKSDAESETSPGVLLASGYIAGGTLCGLIIAFFSFLPDSFNDAINLGLQWFSKDVTDDDGKVKRVWKPDADGTAQVVSVLMFGALAAFLVYIGSRRETEPDKPAATA